MSKRLKIVLVATAAAVAVLVPVIAQATSTESYTTTLQATDPATKIGYFYGSLTLTIAHGIVQGWYKPQYDDGYVRVQGSYKNGQYWLSFANSALQVYAMKQHDGTLKGTATDAAPTVIPTIPTFSSAQIKPIASTDLYPLTFEFSAKPT
jgi:hypothetical protein